MKNGVATTGSAVHEALDPVSVARLVGATLDDLGITWVIGGSLASSVHGEPRSTQDVDMVVALAARRVPALCTALERDFYVDADVARDAAETGGTFNAVHFASSVKVDFFVAGSDPFEAERLARRLRVEVDGSALYVDTAEHILLRKLEWYRRGGGDSERQWRDITAIARIQGARLDRGRLSHWAARLGVSDLLERVLR